MLVIVRKTREGVVISRRGGDEHICTIRVLSVSPTKVRLGFDADEVIIIEREEVYSGLEPRDP